MKQIIIIRKDLNMSLGKTCGQVSHASMAFISNILRESLELIQDPETLDYYLKWRHLEKDDFNKEIYDDWICKTFTKVVCGAKNKYQLLKVIDKAKDLGLEEGKDFFLIKDNCYTELEPEEYDESGQGRCLTCIGFKPLPDEIASQISKKYQLL